MRKSAVVVAFGLLACSGHPDEGTLIEPGPGVQGVPGGSKGVSASRALPISGGTLQVAGDGRTAIVADPDRDIVWLVDLELGDVREVVLQPGDEPGRSVDDGSGRVHVALRSGGAVVAIDLATAEIARRTDVCPAPRGIDHEPLSNRIHVACQTGELVTLDSDGGIVQSVDLGRDLRDVIADGGRLLVSRFRSAELLVVDAEGQVVAKHQPPHDDVMQRTPFVAWRTVRDPAGGVLMLHQRASEVEVGIQPGGYGSSGAGGCFGGGGIVDEAVSRVDPDSESPPIVPPVLPLLGVAGPADLAVSSGGSKIAIAATGNSWSVEQPELGGAALPRLLVVGADFANPSACGATPATGVDGEPTAVAWWGPDRIVVQSREPAELQIVEGMAVVRTIPLSDDSRADTGLALFHMNVTNTTFGNAIACASCHAEGGEDGRTWTFASLGKRRTQTLAGGVMDRAPFHWDGTLKTFDALVNEVMVSRMSGPNPNKNQEERFASWIDTIPAPARPHVDAAAAERGKALFEDPKVGCADCHTGPAFTNNSTVNVGTGMAFQVPSLIGVGARAPFLHDGCAPTLRDRFGACGGGDLHGATSHLSAEQIDDLVAYLESI